MKRKAFFNFNVMTQEEKARKYDDALANARQEYNTTENVERKQWLEELFPEFVESEDERIRKWIIEDIRYNMNNEPLNNSEYKKKAEKAIAWLEKQVSPQMVADAYLRGCNETEEKLLEKQNEQKNKINSYKITFKDVLALECAMKTIKITKGGNKLYEMLVLLYNKIHNVYLLEKQGEQKPTQEIEPFEAEHGKYYYCIKDYFCGGRKQASKGDVVQALRGLPIMGLKDASEYFLPVNSIKCNSAWSKEDEKIFSRICALIHSAAYKNYDVDEDGNECGEYANIKEWFKKLKDRVQPQPMQEWDKEDEEIMSGLLSFLLINTSDQWAKYGKWILSLKERIKG